MSWRCTDPPHALSRRACLLALLALAASRRPRAAEVAATSTDAELRAALDALLPRRGASQASARDRLATLEHFNITALSPSAAIDLATVRAGLVLDARIETLGAGRPGSAYFALRVERNLGEALAPDAAQRLLATEVKRLSDRSDVLLRQLGYRNGTLGARFLAAAADPRWLYSDDSAGRDSAVADMNRVLAAAKARLPAEFSAVPAYCLNVRVTQLSPEEVAACKGGYRLLPTAQSAGTYVVDLREIRRRPRWSLPSVAHHELLPGHLLQLPLEAAAGAHPLRLEYTSAFPEGWATYAEALGAEHGVYKGDAAAELGVMHWLVFRG